MVRSWFPSRLTGGVRGGFDSQGVRATLPRERWWTSANVLFMSSGSGSPAQRTHRAGVDIKAISGWPPPLPFGREGLGMGGRRPRQAGGERQGAAGLLPCQARMAARQATALSASGGRTGAAEDSGASAERRRQRTAGHRAVAVVRVLVGTERSSPKDGRRKTRQRLQRRPQGCGAGLRV